MSAGGLDWWVGVAPAEGEIDCDGATHRLRWADGGLHALDHADPEADRALVALGGERPACLQILDAWAQHSATPELVTLGRRPGEQGLGLAPVQVRSLYPVTVSRTGRISRLAAQRLEARARRLDALSRLLALPAPFIDRLVLSVIASAAQRWDDEEFRADHGLRFGAALSARATPALRRFGDRLAVGPADTGVSPARPGYGEPVVAARLEPGQPLVVSADLPLRWLSDVWGRGLSEPDGEFVLDVVSGAPDGSTFEVLVAEWEPAGPITWEAAPIPATVTLDADGIRRVRRHW